MTVPPDFRDLLGDDLPPEERLEATIATTALAAAAGVDIVRVHDVRPNARAARLVDAIWRTAPGGGAGSRGGLS